MGDDANINDVSDTSFWVAYYRAQESERNDSLFQDRFAKLLVGRRGKKIADSMAAVSRYAQWSVVARTVIIDRFIERLIKEDVDAVINLGAGLDARPYRMKLPSQLEWIEVDFPNIIAHKTRILASEQPTCKLTRLEVDLTARGQRQALFSSVLPHAKKVLVLTEGVVPYLDPRQVAELAEDLRVQSRFHFWILEYLHPKVYPILNKTERTSKMKNAPFRFYPEDWYGFFKQHGWIEKETHYTGEIAREFNRKLPMPKLASLIFPLLPKRVKEQARRMAGYMVLHRG